MKRFFLLLLVMLLPLAAIQPTSAQALEKHRLILDWFPNADHVPLYVARDAGFFAKEGLEIELIPPADPNDPLKLVAAEQASFAINYQPNVIIARDAGLKVRSVGVLVEHPLSSLAFLKRSGIKTPADLKGKTIGYSVQLLEMVLLGAVMESAGVKKDEYKTINVNFNLTSSLLTGKVDAVIGAFWNYELAELELEKVPGGYFDLRKYGVPDYYELIVISNDNFLKKGKPTARKLSKAIQAAVEFSRANPKKALEIYFKANPEVRKPLDKRAFELTLTQFATTQKQSAEKWATFVEFAKKRKLIKRSIPAQELFLNP